MIKLIITRNCKNILERMEKDMTDKLDELIPLLKEAQAKGDLSENMEYSTYEAQVSSINMQMTIVKQMISEPTTPLTGQLITQGRIVRLTEMDNYADEPRLVQNESNYVMNVNTTFNRDLLISDIAKGFDRRTLLLDYGVVSSDAPIIAQVLNKPEGVYEVRPNPQLLRKVRYEIIKE